MGESHFDNVIRIAGSLRRPIPKRRPEAMDGDVAVEMRDRRADRSALPLILLADDDPVLALAPLLEQRRGPVGRAVVDDHDLVVEAERLDALEHFADRRLFVVGGDDEGDAHCAKRRRGG